MDIYGTFMDIYGTLWISMSLLNRTIVARECSAAFSSRNAKVLEKQTTGPK